MVKSDERGREHSFIEVFHWIQYLENHYGTQVELHFSRNEDDNRNAVLCITAVGNCKCHRTRLTYDYSSIEVAYNSLQRVPQLADKLFYELNERLDGSCDECRGK